MAGQALGEKTALPGRSPAPQKDHDIKEEIKARLDIVDVIGETVTLTPSPNGWWKGAVSATSESGGSLNVNQKEQYFNDWAGGSKGDVLAWIAYAENLDIKRDFPEVLRIAADKAGVTLPDTKPGDIEKARERAEMCDLLTDAAEIYHKNLKPEHYDFIKGKWGINRETVDKLKIGYSTPGRNLEALDIRKMKKSGLVYVNNGMAGAEVFRGRYIFPYWKGEKVVYMIGRLTPETPLTKEGKEPGKYFKLPVNKEGQAYISETIQNGNFYGEDSIKGADYCILTEGVTDCITAMQAGFPCISPVTTQFREDDYPKLLKLTERLKTVYICNDNEENESGLKGALKTAEVLEGAGIETRIIELPKPEGINKIDVAEYLKNHTGDDLKNLMAGAAGLWDFKLSRQEVPDKALERLRAFKAFISNELTGMKPEEWRVFATNEAREYFKLEKEEIKSIITKRSDTEATKSTADVANGTFCDDFHNNYDTSEYTVKGSGIFKTVKAGKEQYEVKISSTPATITTKGKNLDTEKSLYKLKYSDLDGDIKEVWKTGPELLTRAGVLGLLNDGFLFTEDKCKDIYQYFFEVISNNSRKMERETVASKNGWKKDNDIFIMGETGHKASGAGAVLSHENEGSEYYNKSGTFEAWAEGVKPLLDYDITRFQCYAAMAATLLKPLGVSSFIVDNYAESGTAKTIRGYIALSMIGDPAGLKINALSTNVGLEKTAEFNRDLPMFIDETSENKDFKNFVYMLSNEKGKTRGTKEGGIRKGADWKTVVLTTGERPITNDKDFSGQQVRVIEIHSSINEHIPETVKSAENAIKSNYGHISEPYFEELFKEMGTLKQTYNNYYEALPKTKSNLGERSKAFFAAIATAGHILETVFEKNGIEKKDSFKICKNQFETLVMGNPTVHYAIRALETTYQWTIRNRAFFDTTKAGGHTVDHHELYGWVSGKDVDIDPDKLSEYLKTQDLDYTRVIEDWREMGITKNSTGAKVYQATHYGGKVNVIRLPIKTITEKLGFDETTIKTAMTTDDEEDHGDREAPKGENGNEPKQTGIETPEDHENEERKANMIAELKLFLKTEQKKNGMLGSEGALATGFMSEYRGYSDLVDLTELKALIKRAKAGFKLPADNGVYYDHGEDMDFAGMLEEEGY